MITDYRTLPEEFLNKMKELLGESYEEYTASFSEAPHYGLRVNRLKLDADLFRRMVSWTLRPVPWIENGFYYEESEVRPSRHPYYAAGLYYLQEPSAMTPANLLPVTPGDCVLDLCAAPGGKSTELAAKLQGTGLLFSNDISNSRAKALLKNLELAGAANICVASETPEKLARSLEGFFDKILVDAPCSGEGMFRRDPDMVKSYREKGPDYYCELQKEIARQAVRMLKPGGMMVYSTCTFDEREDEGVIRYLLAEFPELTLVPLEQKDGFEPGIGLSECVRLFPHQIRGEGHFIALMQKWNGSMSESNKISGNPGGADNVRKTEQKAEDTGALPGKTFKPSKALQPVLEFLGSLHKEFAPERLYQKNENVYYLPEPIAAAGKETSCGRGRNLLQSIRYLRTGLLLGEIKNGRFEPSQALAMSLKKEEAQNVLNLDSGDERVLRYLKGETVALTEEEQGSKHSGFVLVCTDGFPLGWAKRAGGNLKNKYYPGWRWQ